MDKRVIFASAGSGKTTFIVNSLSYEKRSLIITYTTNNYNNLAMKIANKFNGTWPENITLMTYFQFLYQFCYKPFLSDKYKTRGLIFNQSLLPRYATQTQKQFYMSSDNYLYSCRLSLLLNTYLADKIKNRIVRYFDEFIIDEVQDIAGRDFDFLETLMGTEISMLFVGDYYQHTYDTSRDGNVNCSLFNDFTTYESRFISKGVISDKLTLKNSWRCGPKICDYISTKLGIAIASNKPSDNSEVFFISDPTEQARILSDPSIIKLNYQKSYIYGPDHRNWGDTKGEDKYENVCVILNKTTADLHRLDKLYNLKPNTRNKLYVAITRAHGNVYLMYE